MNALRRLLGRLIHPFPPFPLIAGQYCSPLEARICADGAAHVDRVFAGSPAIRAISTAFVRFMGGDAETERALKKAYHTTCEQRARTLALRLEPAAKHGFDDIPAPTDTHPIDRFVAAEIGRMDARAAALTTTNRGRAAHLLSAVLWAAALAIAPAAILIRRGRPTVTPRRVDVLACETVRDRIWSALVQAARDEGTWREGAMAILRMNGTGHGGGVLPAVNAPDLPVPRGRWWREVVLPGLRLAGTALVVTWRNRTDARVVETAVRALNLACTGLKVRQVGYALSFRIWLDDAEHDPTHAMKAIVARKTGARAVRFPRTEQDSPGTMLDFMGYDIYPAGGPYQLRTYGSSWNPRCDGVSLGLMQYDRRLRQGEHVAPEIERAIGARLGQGKRMAVFFGPSDVPGLERPMRELFDTLVTALAGHKDWFIVLKPKLMNWFGALLAADPRHARWVEQADIVTIGYPRPGEEVCPSNWLIERMSFGTGWQGTIAVEALARGRPFFCWYPFTEQTPYKINLASRGLLTNDFESYRRAIEAYAKAPDPAQYDLGWFRDTFDPFGDGNALGRLADLLLGEKTPATQSRALVLERT
jgi:hypothetical protein